MILLIDNYDSFVYNLARYFEELGHATTVVRNDQISIAEIKDLAPKAIVLSPGPCTPDEAGICLEVVQEFAQHTAILGVCLGHQVIAQAFGGKVRRSHTPMHGKSSMIAHTNAQLFAGLANPMQVGRYHSLSIDVTDPHPFIIDATSPDGEVMAIRHKDLPCFGVQFHPESILTPEGQNLLANFLEISA